MKLRPLDGRIVILIAVIGMLRFGTGKVIAAQQSDENATIRAMERLAKIGEKPKSSAELTITSEDFPLYKGMNSTFSISGCDGTAREVTIEVCDEVLLGDVTIYKLVRTFNGKSAGGGYVKKSKESLERYSITGGQLPEVMIRFPLAKGASYEYQNVHGKAKAWVEGPEEADTPAGKFMCLVLVHEIETAGTPLRTKSWIAPGLGNVKIVAQCAPEAKQKEFRSVLKNTQMGTVPISNFDFVVDPLVPATFPNSRWKTGKGEKGAFSACELDTTNGAAGTPFSLKWNYHTRGTWVNVGLLLSGSWDKSVDLSQYDSISFYIKASTERGCGFKIQSAPWKEKVLTGASIPLKPTSQWRKVVIDLKTHPELRNIDLTKTYTIGFVDWDKEDASNVVWVDEIMLHKTNDKIKSGTKIDKE